LLRTSRKIFGAAPTFFLSLIFSLVAYTIWNRYSGDVFVGGTAGLIFIAIIFAGTPARRKWVSDGTRMRRGYESDRDALYGERLVTVPGHPADYRVLKHVALILLAFWFASIIVYGIMGTFSF
jgi:hypothetical protein